MAKTEVPFSPFVASIFEANARQSADTHNRVIANVERELEETRRNYRALYDGLESLNERLDSLSVERLLDMHSWKVGDR